MIERRILSADTEQILISGAPISRLTYFDRNAINSVYCILPHILSAFFWIYSGSSVNRFPLSCFIIAKDEEDRIARTIRSVREWVDEVVVVDSESSDRTVAIASAEGARVITQPWLGFGGQKRFAEDQCRNDWVLNLDADEVVTEYLRQEIKALFARQTPNAVAYEMLVNLVYPGDERPRPWARDHVYVRLYNRKVLRFRDSQIHDSVVTDGQKVVRLRGAIFHHSIRSFEHLRAKLKERMELSAKYRTSACQLSALRLVLEFPANFYKYYIVRRHFMGGVKGLRYAWITAGFRASRALYIVRVGHAGWQISQATSTGIADETG